MVRKPDHPATQVMAWVGLSIGLPLIPVITGIAMTLMQRRHLNLFALIDGLELFLISLWLVTATAWDLSKHDFRWEMPVRMALVALAAIDLIFLVIIYVNNRMKSLDLDREAYLTIAVGHFLLIALGTVVLQLYMHHTEREAEGENQ